MSRLDFTLAEQQTIYLPVDALDPAEAALLHQRYRRQIEVEPPSFKTGDQWRLSAQGWVGWLPLTRRLGFVLRPKVTLHDLFRMLEIAYDLAGLHFLPGLIQVESLPELYARLAYLLAQRVLARGRKGLYRAYITHEQSLPVVRGRIQTHRLGAALASAAVPCAYQQLTTDVADNRILAWTLYRLAQSGLCTGDTQLLVDRARQLLAGQVTLTPQTAAACLGRSYTRLNQDYAPLHALCAFFLDQCGPGHLSGDRPMIPFLVDMARLYERFVAAWLTPTAAKRLSRGRAGPDARWRRSALYHRFADQRHSPPLGGRHQIQDAQQWPRCRRCCPSLGLCPSHRCSRRRAGLSCAIGPTTGCHSPGHPYPHVELCARV